ncbi:acyl-CoA dehydrogenase family protein [Quadrisphaera sp. KR29]|uniref:acyl-CoA dehydrogenase family protein n=1 Tax=Quadrisphaera sp. KR29 TaxID=3461391 RepID=UPI004043A66A
MTTTAAPTPPTAPPPTPAARSAGALPLPAGTRELLDRYAGVLDAVGAGAVRRERERRLPLGEVELLRSSGFTRTTLPQELGGDGTGYEGLFELLTELARRDSNLAQALRSHFSFVDRTLLAAPSRSRTARLALLAGGAVHGNATFERSSAASGGAPGAALTRDEHGLRLDGTKYYSTGTLYADLVSVAVPDPEPPPGRPAGTVGVLVRTDAPGVRRLDDWDGFGQRLTGSGTTVFEGVRVHEDDVVERGAPGHAGAFVQLVLLAVLAGIARAVVDDAVTYVRARTRRFSHASASSAAEDPLVQEVVGDLSARSAAATAAVRQGAAALTASGSATTAGAPAEEVAELVGAADLVVAQAQLVVLPQVLAAATDLFEVGGASALAADLALDRHWRNARTVASHNPARYKARALGDHLLNGTPLPSWWTVGEG